MEDHPHVVLDQHDRQLLLLVQPADQLGDVVGFLVAHAGGRLVEQQQARLQGQRHHDLGRALIAVGQLAHQPVGLAGEPALLQQLADALARSPASPAPRQPGPQAQAPPPPRPAMRRFSRTRQLGEDLGDLEGARHAELATRWCAGRSVMSRPSKQDAARGRREEAADQIEEGGLAGAVGADHGAQLARLDRERDVVDGDQAAEGARDVLDLEQAHACTLRREDAEHAAREEQHHQHEEQRR